ncbi:hypothetical protein Pyn_18739 [Prunus yedoensis var. nudiflora]|uniref:Uncharacterized protein n=1 Tax=Prunus yedoensis var. nudiflora TaxID=2094558 RepID=A0A314Y892_PRUYE|nr:hypothetical protein Pyn_18739 [Prunus yedoensis var. nudiflora]
MRLPLDIPKKLSFEGFEVSGKMVKEFESASGVSKWVRSVSYKAFICLLEKLGYEACDRGV